MAPSCFERRSAFKHQPQTDGSGERTRLVDPVNSHLRSFLSRFSEKGEAEKGEHVGGAAAAAAGRGGIMQGPMSTAARDDADCGIKSSACGKVQEINLALQHLVHEKRMNNDHLNGLLSQLEYLKKDANANDLLNEESIPKSVALLSNNNEECKEYETQEAASMDEIMRELKHVRRQNTITHCLLSVLIVVTAVWQFSEVSMLLNLRNKISSPFQAVGDLIFTIIGRRKSHASDILASSLKIPQLEGSPVPQIGLPELPLLESLSSPSDNGGD